jgi:2,4-dienoyl-CoA reductase-like NADH-dependent reductase (Old Yellow Enzyme family)
VQIRRRPQQERAHREARPQWNQVPHLSPVKLRHLELKNRIVFGAHTVNMSHEGLPGDRHFGYYRERARGAPP